MEFLHKDEHTDEGLIIIQANLDDMNPEWTSYITDLLLAEGANDVYWIPIIMKKGRPGVMLNVLTAEDRLPRMETVIFRETTTLGVRYIRTACHRLGRSFEKVETRFGVLSVKVGYHQGQAVQFAPEFRECEEAAKRYGVPLKDVYDEVRSRYMGRP
ncbi:nickel insertion protein [Gorillibacterium sp. sgz5001074]|uniref:nickel insertion protein n=1 Tax=Gorillibacterium sp. sgz5001074 TaxID=3446695 RepID=UPI003F66D3D9